MKIYPKKFLKIIFIAVLALCFGLSVVLFASAPHGAQADGEYSEFLPNKSEEYYALNSPIHAYSDIDITAVTESQKLVIFTENGTVVKDGFNSLKQINRVGNRIFYADNGPLYTLPVSNPSAAATELKDSNLAIISGTFFDTNGTYLATMFSSNIQVYSISDAPIKITTIEGVQEKPVAINSNSMFYVAGNMICRKDFDNLSAIPTIYNSELLPDYSMIASDEFVYFISGTKIMRLNVKEPATEQQELHFAHCDYDLGTVHEPQRLAFKNGNLLITDKDGANGSVQEFKINGDTLEFTGYAIASGLSAYNRVAANATDIERYGKYVAALDGNKLTVIDTENCADYNKDYFVNKYVGSAPNKFALGNDTILYSKGTVVSFAVIELNHIVKEHNTAFYKNSDLTEELFELSEGETVKLLENKDGVSKVKATSGDGAVDGYVAEDSIKEIPIIKEKYAITGLPDGAPNDISYQSGAYYLIYLSTNSKIVKIDEMTGETDETEFNGVAANLVAADVFGNIYVAYNDKIYKNNGAMVFNLTSNAQKLATDLAGNLFALAADGKIYKLAANANAFDAPPALDVTGELGTIKTFGMDFDRSEIYFLVDGKEQVYRTTIVGNVSLEDVTPNDGFINATASKRELKIYSVKGDAVANAYSVSQDGNAFKFNGLIEKAAEYPLISEISVSNFTMCALASEKGVVLINKSELEEKAIAPAEAPEKAFLTTSVYAYAIPVIEKNGTFIIESESGKIKIDKGATVKVNGAFTLLGKTFYDATAKVNGEDLACYIPADFTATVLSENFEFESYTVEKVKKTVLYKNADLTEELLELEDGETVKLLESNDGVLKVAVTYQDGTVIGYVSENSLVVNPDAIVRNVLIILAVFGSLAGTISYFLLRKKR